MLQYLRRFRDNRKSTPAPPATRLTPPLTPLILTGLMTRERMVPTTCLPCLESLYPWSLLLSTVAVARRSSPLGSIRRITTTLNNRLVLLLLIAKYQKRDKTLQRNVQLHKGDSKYSTTMLEGVEVITEHSKVYIPSKLQSRVVAWYHDYLVHPGEKRTEKTIRQNLTWQGLRTQV